MESALSLILEAKEKYSHVMLLGTFREKNYIPLRIIPSSAIDYVQINEIDRVELSGDMLKSARIGMIPTLDERAKGVEWQRPLS